MSDRHEFVTSDGVALRYFIDDFTDPWRQADTLVLLHAAMGSSRRFRGWVPHLSRNFRVVRLDLRGHGESKAPTSDGPWHFDRLALDVKELIEHLNVGPVHIAGSSAGGILSQATAFTHPELVKSLASFAAPPGMKVGRQDYDQWLAKIGKMGLAGFLRETIADRMNPAVVDPDLIDWFIKESARNNVEWVGRFVVAMKGKDITSEVSRIKCPALIVVPGDDPIHRLDEYGLLKDRLQNCRFVVYEGMRHNITDAVPDRCAKELLGFLSSLP